MVTPSNLRDKSRVWNIAVQARCPEIANIGLWYGVYISEDSFRLRQAQSNLNRKELIYCSFGAPSQANHAELAISSILGYIAACPVCRLKAPSIIGRVCWRRGLPRLHSGPLHHITKAVLRILTPENTMILSLAHPNIG